MDEQTMFGVITRNSPYLVIVPNWQEFVEWVKDGGGYDESYLDINDSRCLRLQEDYLAVLEAEK